MKRTFTQDERDIVFDLWKRGAGFSDIGRVIDAKPGSIFTILREHGGIQPEKRLKCLRTCYATLLRCFNLAQPSLATGLHN